MNFIKLNEYCDINDVKYVEINIVIEHGQKRPKCIKPYYNLTPTFGEPQPNKDGKIISQNVFTCDFYKTHKNQVRPHINIDEYNAFGVDTQQTQQLDFDTETPEAQRIIEEIKHDGAPFFLSYSKRLPHFVFKSKHNLEQNTYDMFSKVTHEHLGELLCGQWSYAKPDEEVQNYGAIWEIDVYDNQWIYIKTKEEKSKPNKKEKIMCKQSINEMSLQPITEPITEDDEILLQYCDCVDIADVDSYNTWKKMVWSLYGHKEVARCLSRMGDEKLNRKDEDKKYNEDSFEKMYQGYKDRGITIKTFYEFAKKGNRDKYFEILNSDPNKKEIEEQDEKFLDICNMEDTEIAHTLFIYFGDNFVKEGDNIYYWDEPNKKWICDNNSKENNFAFTSIYIKDAIKNLTSTYLEKKNYYKLKENEDEENMISRKLQNYWKKSKELLRDCKLNPIVKWFMKYLVQRNDKIEFDANCDLFAFENKVYDFTIKDFREIEKHDYISMTSQIDYKEPEQEEVDKVKEIIENIIPDVDERRTYISLLYNAMTGYSSNKLVLANGSGGNGKSVIHCLFNLLMGKYGIDGHNSLLTSDIKSGANTELSNINKKRWVNFSELDISLPLNVANCKKLSGGGYMSARGLWSDKDKCNVNSLSVFIEVNKKPDLNGVDTNSNALVRRVLDFGFKSIFTENEEDVDEKNHIYPINRDYTKDSFKKKHACALFKYITNYEGVEEIYVCDSIKEASSKYLLGNDAVFIFVNDIIEKVDDKDSVIKISDLYEDFKISECFLNMTKNEKKTYNKRNFLEYIQRHSKFKNNFKEKYQNGKCMERYEVTQIRNVLINYKMRVDEES